MADRKTKWEENAIGAFYVDAECIACDICVVEAPRFFTMNKIDCHAFTLAQPKTEKEIKECLIALEACPVQAIGSDGALD